MTRLACGHVMCDPGSEDCRRREAVAAELRKGVRVAQDFQSTAERLGAVLGDRPLFALKETVVGRVQDQIAAEVAAQGPQTPEEVGTYRAFVIERLSPEARAALGHRTPCDVKEGDRIGDTCPCGHVKGIHRKDAERRFVCDPCDLIEQFATAPTPRPEMVEIPPELYRQLLADIRRITKRLNPDGWRPMYPAMCKLLEDYATNAD